MTRRSSSPLAASSAAMRSSTRFRTSERAISSEPASARSMTRAISGADKTSSTASSSGLATLSRRSCREERGRGRVLANPERSRSSFGSIGSAQPGGAVLVARGATERPQEPLRVRSPAPPPRAFFAFRSSPISEAFSFAPTYEALDEGGTAAPAEDHADEDDREADVERGGDQLRRRSRRSPWSSPCSCRGRTC